MIYYVVNNEFNQAHYSDIIGVMYSNPPAYAIVKELPDPFRLHECWNCNQDWMAKVELKGNSNLSAESNQYCPKCHTKSSCASSWIQENGNPYPFPEPIKPSNQ
jgi:hypothetical protein